MVLCLFFALDGRCNLGGSVPEEHLNGLVISRFVAEEVAGSRGIHSLSEGYSGPRGVNDHVVVGFYDYLVSVFSTPSMWKFAAQPVVHSERSVFSALGRNADAAMVEFSAALRHQVPDQKVR